MNKVKLVVIVISFVLVSNLWHLNLSLSLELILPNLSGRKALGTLDLIVDVLELKQ